MAWAEDLWKLLKAAEDSRAVRAVVPSADPGAFLAGGTQQRRKVRGESWGGKGGRGVWSGAMGAWGRERDAKGGPYSDGGRGGAGRSWWGGKKVAGVEGGWLDGQGAGGVEGVACGCDEFAGKGIDKKGRAGGRVLCFCGRVGLQ